MTSEKTLNWMEGLARRLVQYAARRAPGELPERLTEEWLADMSERRQGFSRLRFALGCCWATSIIARDRGFVAVQATSTVVAPASLGGFIRLTPSFSSRRTATFVLVASLHAVALGGLMLGLTAKYHKSTPPDLQTKIIDQPRPPVDVPTIDKPNLIRSVFEVPPIEKLPPIRTESVIEAVETQTPTDVRHPDLPAPSARDVNRVAGRPGAGFPNTNDFYPPGAIRAETQGLAAVNACLDAKGRLTSDPSILESTGSAILDQAALRLARAGSGHFQPSTEDGKPVDACIGFRVRFTLKR
jgi:periplasmic protein TonB